MPTSNYGPATTAAEVVADVDLHGRRAIVTGASSGIGTETARALASAGADVTLAVRNVKAGTEVARGSPKSSRRGTEWCTSPGWIWLTLRRWPISCAVGRNHCTS
jgi:NAD(P)-dependent dehydrogenase (short-subunit alcohol dehydrogenase family)